MRSFTFNFSVMARARPVVLLLLLLAGGTLVLGTAKLYILDSITPGLRNIPEQFWLRKAHSRATYDAVAIGDSRLYRGFSPGEFSASAGGLTAVNLGFSSAALTGKLLSFGESRLSANGQRVLILGVTPLSLSPVSASNRHLHQFLDRSALPLHVPRAVATVLDSGQTVSTVYAVLGWFGAGPLNDPSSGYFQIAHDSGWVESDRRPNEHQSALEEYRAVFDNNAVSIPMLNQLCATIERWLADGISVFAFRPPASRAIEAIEDSKSGFEEAMVRARLTQAGAVWLEIDDRYSFYSYDGSHLRGDAARRLSRQLGAKVAAILRTSKGS